MAAKNLTAVMTKVYEAIKDLSPEERHNIIRSVFALLGEQPPINGTPSQQSLNGHSHGARGNDDFVVGDRQLGLKARQWAKANGVSLDKLQDSFHIENGAVSIIANDIDGNGRRERTRSCYFLAGIGNLLATDVPTVDEKAVIDLCKRYGCHDVANHAAIRRSVQMVGNKKEGFALTVPALKDAAAAFKGARE